MLRVGASDCVQGGHKMYTGSGQMSLCPVLAAARVVLHQSACGRGIQAVPAKRWGAWAAVAPCPIEVDTVGYSVA
jgi:hypothetical protein